MRLYQFISVLFLKIALLTSFAGNSQASKDSCFTTEEMRGIATKLLQKKVLEERVVILSARVDTLQAIIRQLETKDAATVEGYESELKTVQEELKIYMDQVETFEKIVRREKRRRFFTAVGGTLATGAAMYLYITK